MQTKLATTTDRTSKSLHKEILQLDLAKFDTKKQKTLSRLIHQRQLQPLRQYHGQNCAYNSGVDS